MNPKFPFDGRNRRPPRDPINALLSLGYTFLTQEITTVLESQGLDPYVGVYHEPTANRPSLALDLIEPFRHVIVDRLVLRAVNLGRLKAEDFTDSEEQGIRLQPDAFKTFIGEFERLMSSPSSDEGFEAHDCWRAAVHEAAVQRKNLVRQVVLNVIPPDVATDKYEVLNEVSSQPLVQLSF